MNEPVEYSLLQDMERRKSTFFAVSPFQSCLDFSPPGRKSQWFRPEQEPTLCPSHQDRNKQPGRCEGRGLWKTDCRPVISSPHLTRRNKVLLLDSAEETLFGITVTGNIQKNFCRFRCTRFDSRRRAGTLNLCLCNCVCVCEHR